MAKQIADHHVGNFMFYEARLETNLLQLYAHLEISEWFSVASNLIIILRSKLLRDM